MRRLPLFVVVVVVASLLSACTHTHSTAPAINPAQGTTTAGLYVAVGAGDSRGEGTDNPLRDAWTQLFLRSLPLGFAFVNLAGNGATTADALNTQLSQALALHPTLVTVSLSVNDLLGSVPAAKFRTELTALIHGLRAGGATVLLASVPRVQALPTYLACIDAIDHPGGCSSVVAKPVPSYNTVAAEVAAYNTVITGVAALEGAVVVNLAAAGTAIESPGRASPFGADGFDPNPVGAEVIASLFEAAWRSRPPAARPG